MASHPSARTQPLLADQVRYHSPLSGMPQGYHRILAQNQFSTIPSRSSLAELFLFTSLDHTSVTSVTRNRPSSHLYILMLRHSYIGRTVQEIGVVDYTTMAFSSQSLGKSFEPVRTFFWWFYTFLALMTLYTTEKKGQLPRFVHMRVSTVHCRQQSLGLGSSINRALTRIALTTPLSILDVQGAKIAQYPVTVLELISALYSNPQRCVILPLRHHRGFLEPQCLECSGARVTSSCRTME